MMSKTRSAFLSLYAALTPALASAKCGNVDYSWGADALASAHDYAVTMMLYVPKVLNKAECRRRKLNELYDKINCFSMIYGQNGNYNLS
jgi:hypothetical protein